MAGERPAFVDHFCFGRQRSPAAITATEAPGDPRWAPFITGSPNPAEIGQPHPASIMVSGPSEVFVRNPSPSVIGVGPVAIGIWSPRRIARGNVRLPAVAVVTDLDPAPAVEVVIKEIDRNFLALPLGREGQEQDR